MLILLLLLRFVKGVALKVMSGSTQFKPIKIGFWSILDRFFKHKKTKQNKSIFIVLKR